MEHSDRQSGTNVPSNGPLRILFLPTLLPPSITNFLRPRCMRPLVSFSTFLTFFLAVALVAADHQEIIDDPDSRIYYSDDWKIVSISVVYA